MDGKCTKKRHFKACSIALAVCLMLAPQFSRVLADTYTETVNVLCDTELDANAAITRAEFIVCLAKLYVPSHVTEEVSLPFEDEGLVKPEDRSYISVLYKAGILSAYNVDGKLYLRPDKTITREEALTLLGKALGASSDGAVNFTDADAIAPWAVRYAAWFAENGILRGYPDGSLGPKNEMTAGHAAVVLVKTLERGGLLGTRVTSVSGVGSSGFLDGKAAAAKYTLPCGVTIDRDGNIIVFDTYNNALRKIDKTMVSTITGRRTETDDNRLPKGFYYDGVLMNALFNRPSDGAYNTNGDLFICDSENHVIRIVRDGNSFTFSGTVMGHADGAGNKARFNNPRALALDKNGNIYVADTLNNCIRKLDSKGNAITIAGVPGTYGFADGAAKEALFLEPAGIAVTDDGKTIYVSDTGNHCIRKIEGGKVTTITGAVSEKDVDGYPFGDFADGAAKDARFNLPAGITLADGIIIVADSGNNRIRAITESGQVVTVAGNGEAGDKEGGVLFAEFNHPMDVFYHNGILYIADTSNNRIKQIPFDADLYKLGGTQ